MRSRVDARRVVEWVLRVVSIAILIALVIRVWERGPGDTKSDVGSGARLAEFLPRWTATGYAQLHLQIDAVPPRDQREWLAALRRAGARTTWSSSKVTPFAGTFTQLPDPAGASELEVGGSSGDTLIVTNALAGLMDTVVMRAGSASINIPGALNEAGFATNGGVARAAARDTIVFRRLLVEGAASWETKFTIAALAERGWRVDALTHVAPGVDVRVGNPGPPDTSRYAAVIAIDSSAALIAAGASRFVRTGGGLVTLRDAASVGPPSSKAVTLERRGDVDVHAYRFGGGRVIRAGYADLWRERMSGDDTTSNPVARHRAWLARVVASVAYAPRLALSPDSTADPAPYASLVEAIGPSARVATGDASSEAPVPSAVLFTVLIASLLLELLSRRLRGAR